ncbi:unnamed protein product [Prunus brigantina]
MGDNSIVGAVAAASTNLCVSDSIPGNGSNTWIIDTGASDHMTYDAKFFDELSSNTRDPYITSANGLPSPITGEGTISLTPTLSLSRALLVPNIHCNLLSVGRLLDTLNASATFYPTHCSFQDLKTHETIGHEFCTMVSTQFHAQVKVFRTDNGGEYVNNTLASFFRAQGIIHQTTTPFTPQQNGVSERKNRQLLEVARSLMLDMSVPHHLWGHAVLSAAYLINRTPSRVLDFKTPHDVFGDHVSPVSVSKLPPKVFGCVAYVHVYSHQRSKLDPCALRCVFIGYSSTQKGYKCYHPPTQKVHVTLDVTFHEEVPYYVSPSSPIQGERGSELESLGLENDVFEDAALGKETTCRTEASDRSLISEDETCGPCEETTDRPLELDQSPISRNEAGALGVTEASDQSPVSENNDSDSCMDEFDVIPPSALPLPQSTHDTVGCKWVFTLKHKADGSIDRYKARLVAKGYTQTYGVDYLETFASVAKLNTVRVLLSLAANRDWPLLQFDVKNAFLHGDLKEEIYMDLPPGIPVTSKEGVVCKLRKSLYGLKQSPRAWFGRFAASMKKFGYVQNDHAEMQNLQKYLASEFEMKSLGDLKYFLGIEVARSKHDVEGYTDADWAGSVTDRRSTSGYFTFVGGNLVTWRSKKQKVVSRSSAEAEYRGMAQGVCELLWLRRLLRDLGFGPQKPMDLYCDNKAAIAIAHNPVQHDRTKHVEVDRHFVKEKLDAEIISFPFISSEYQLADVLTKAVSTMVFLNSLDKLGMRDIFAPT